jgi:hypothetical protein
MQQSFPASTRFNGPSVQPPVASSYAPPVASSRVPMPQTYYPQPATEFGGFRGISPLLPPPTTAPFSLPGIFQPYLGEVPTIGKTFPGYFPSSIPIKTPPVHLIKTIVNDLQVPKTRLVDSVPLKSSGPANSHPTQSEKL